MANFISLLRIFIAIFAVLLLYIPQAWAYISSLILTIIAFAMDGLDGYIARKFNETSDLGAVLDIMGDRIVEMSYWIVFAALGWIWVVFPLVCMTRAFVTDSIRSVALAQGHTAFGEKSMQSSKIGQFICGSKFMRISYAVAKVLAFIIIIAGRIPTLVNEDGTFNNTAIILQNTGLILAILALIFCVVRGLPVVVESKQLFEKK